MVVRHWFVCLRGPTGGVVLHCNSPNGIILQTLDSNDFVIQHALHSTKKFHQYLLVSMPLSIFNITMLPADLLFAAASYANFRLGWLWLTGE